MNKKLFSWKALAGLALLVAMGLTSCKQDNAVTLDEDGNYKVPEKPVTPTASGTNLKGFKTVAELNTLIAGTKDITDNIKAGGSVTINLDCSNLEAAAGDKIIIPGKTDAAINLVFTNKAKKNDGLVIADDALDQLTITFPDGEFGDVSFEMPYSTLTLATAGASTLGKTAFNVNKNNQKDLATTINSGITINTIKTWYKDANDVRQWTGRILAKDGAKIVALLVDEDYNGISNSEKGYDVPQVTTNLSNWEDVYVKDLNIVANNVAVWAVAYDKKVVVNKITIAEGDTATIWNGAATEIVGAGEGAVLTGFYGDYTTKYSNLTIDGNSNGYGGSNDPIDATFENCTLVDFDYIYLSQKSATGLVINFDDNTSTNIYYPVYASASDASYSYTFSKCEFPEGSSVRAFSEGVNILDKDGNPIKETLYAYGWNDPDDDPDEGWIYKDGIEKITDIPEAVRKGETGYYYDYLYEPRTYAFSDLALIPVFSECKYDGAAVSEKNVGKFLIYTTLWGADDTAVATTTQVKIGDKTYKRVYSKNNGWILVEQ